MKYKSAEKEKKMTPSTRKKSISGKPTLARPKKKKKKQTKKNFNRPTWKKKTSNQEIPDFFKNILNEAKKRKNKKYMSGSKSSGGSSLPPFLRFAKTPKNNKNE